MMHMLIHCNGIEICSLKNNSDTSNDKTAVPCVKDTAVSFIGQLFFFCFLSGLTGADRDTVHLYMIIDFYYKATFSFY